MWVVVLFDLPTDTKAAKRAYTDFREHLLSSGFLRLQYSVYARHCQTDENASVQEGKIRAALPKDGEVRIISLTDKQFERMKVFHGKTRQPTEEGPQQLSFF
ncbi:MAG: CRISPR-associated endonuclease Cas2 [Candidatus Obscuribacter sp.]|nr:CRISPR-associated endonuclease Cas2 [Candidatus Obscuribacter sp.]